MSAGFSVLQQHNATHGAPPGQNGSAHGNGAGHSPSRSASLARGVSSAEDNALSNHFSAQQDDYGSMSQQVADGQDHAQDLQFDFSLEHKDPSVGVDPSRHVVVAAAAVAAHDSHAALRSSGGKPPVGSEEWHKQRKDNHKEVERRRRECINEGITDLSRLVPGAEKNKGSILQRAVIYINQLKETDAQNLEKWTLEKLLIEQTMTELSASVDKLKNELTESRNETERLRSLLEKHGINPKKPKHSHS